MTLVDTTPVKRAALLHRAKTMLSGQITKHHRYIISQSMHRPIILAYSLHSYADPGRGGGGSHPVFSNVTQCKYEQNVPGLRTAERTDNPRHPSVVFN